MGLPVQSLVLRLGHPQAHLGIPWRVLWTARLNGGGSIGPGLPPSGQEPLKIRRHCAVSAVCQLGQSPGLVFGYVKAHLPGSEWSARLPSS